MIKFIKKKIYILLLITTFSFIFFYKIDYNTLGSWDEGWYASIARDIINTGEYLDLSWNGNPYYDHPPLGFWLMTLSYKLFGINEFSTRLPSVIAGILSVVFLYKLTSLLFSNEKIGFVASLILGTSVWYVIRVRSGNLDSLLVLFFITTIYFSLKSNKNIKWFPVVALSYGALIMTKTLIGIPVIALITLINLNQLHPKKIKTNFPFFLIGTLLFCALVIPWYNFHLKKYPNFFEHHFVNIGIRNKTATSFLNISIEKPLFYLHMGVRKWYDLWLLGLVSIFATFSFIKKKYFIVLFWNLLILYPFFTSEQTELWHLIPVYVPLSIIIAAGLYCFIDPGLKLLQNVAKNSKLTKRLSIILEKKETFNVLQFLYLAGFIFIAVWQIKIFYPEVYPASKYIPDDVAISKKAGSYSKNIYLDDDYIPLAVYYSGNNIKTIGSLPDGQKTLADFMLSDESPKSDFVVIARNWVVDDLNNKKIPYRLIEKNNSFSIVTKK